MKATAEHYTVLTLSMVLITALSTPLIKLLYDPSRQFLLLAKRRRTMEESMSTADLRVLVCVYTEDHAAPLIVGRSGGHTDHDDDDQEKGLGSGGAHQRARRVEQRVPRAGRAGRHARLSGVRLQGLHPRHPAAAAQKHHRRRQQRLLVL
jgi:hypothetical protein